MFRDTVPPRNGMSKGAVVFLIAGQGPEAVEVECGIVCYFPALV